MNTSMKISPDITEKGNISIDDIQNLNEVQKFAVSDPSLYCFFAYLGLGGVLNIFVFFVLLTSRRNGIFSLVLQLSFVDAFTIFIAVLEVWSVRDSSWIFSADLCPVFSGSEVLTNSLILYLIISLNFHVISIMNLQISQLKIGSRNPLTTCGEDDSNECLVKKTENRSVIIDYRKRKNDVSIIFPTILVWFICLSLSIPDYTLTSTIKLPNNYTLCAIVDNYYNQLIQKLLLLFRVIIPLVLMVISVLVLLYKLYEGNQLKQKLDNVFEQTSYNIRTLVVFILFLTISYLGTSLQRDIIFFKDVISDKENKNNLDIFKTPPLHTSFVTTTTATILSIFHYSSIVLRPIIYVILLPDFYITLKNKLCFAKK